MCSGREIFLSSFFLSKIKKIRVTLTKLKTTRIRLRAYSAKISFDTLVELLFNLLTMNFSISNHWLACGFHIPSHWWVLQGCHSNSTPSASMFWGIPPTQKLPPNAGDGASQLLFLELIPPPHVFVQLTQDSQFSQAPWTTQNIENMKVWDICTWI